MTSYFKRHGWVAGKPVVIRACGMVDRVDEGLIHGVDPVNTVEDLRALGWSGQNAPCDEALVTAFRLESESGPEYWVGLKNFYAITRYNRSVVYATAAHQLSDTPVQVRSNE